MIVRWRRYTWWSPEKSGDVQALPGSIRSVIDSTLTRQRDHLDAETLSGQYASWTSATVVRENPALERSSPSSRTPSRKRCRCTTRPNQLRRTTMRDWVRCRLADKALASFDSQHSDSKTSSIPDDMTKQSPTKLL